MAEGFRWSVSILLSDFWQMPFSTPSAHAVKECCTLPAVLIFVQSKKARTESGPFCYAIYYANYYANLCQYAVILDNIVITPVNAFNGYESRINTEKNSPCQQMTEAVEM